MLAAFTGCAVAPQPTSGVAVDALESTCAGGGSTHNDMPHNDMPHNDMPHNGLTTEALQENAALLAFLSQNPLSTDAFVQAGLEVRQVLATESARTLLSYVVSCALDPCTAVKVKDALGQTHSFRGELGYCGPEAPTMLRGWSGAAPTEACQEMVSSCILARTNALGKRVVLSLRDSVYARPLVERVPVETMYRESRGTDIASFSPCPPDAASVPPAERNCGYSPRYMGRCLAGESVQLTAPPGLVVRVCEGIHGCDHPEGPNPTAGDPRWYSRHLPVTGQSSTGKWKFSCPGTHPEDGTVRAPIGPWRTYGVMLAPLDPAAPVPPEADVQAANKGYPAPETQVFTHREGAFYGNLFQSACTKLPCPAASAMLSGKQYACYSDIWSDGLAVLADRLCASSNADCFQNEPGPCLPAPEGQCDRESNETQRRYTSCGWTDLPNFLTKHTVTVYLNHPCDLNDLKNCALAHLP
ncbi:hypothetical protein [Polyangium spumosum]|uniref:Uncharacterized protein n=1 Tax=Polyangium spumosum TaxID=889282 RepID=A0A6N7PMR8_9BACT|nr:hypothetical protein [Polyangium spumosum]MRG93057.1 hypothetical protein [Polyangium spumosum]